MLYYRKCPKCNKQISHKNKYSRNNCDKKKRLCRSCSNSEVGKRPGLRDNFIKRYATKGENTGSANGFYGKKHSQQSIDRIRNKDMSFAKTIEFSKKISSVTAGSLNPMYGKSYYDIWVEKYGKEEADRRQELKRQNNSKATSGKNNPMYGKPTPQGSGNGWSGWYKGWYFRSLKELSYVVNVLEPNNKTWVPAEKIKIKISYKNWDGKDRTYTPDFLVDNNVLVEIKPKKLFESVNVVIKKHAAEIFCLQKKWTYELIDPPILKINQIISLYNSGIVKFSERYEKKFLEWITPKVL